ncbi:methyltransferase type 12 [Mycobacterium sp. NAZ190054]|nr:methyltransferase type 12 [Mycobacterium sp. NAZ190054]
MYRVGFTPWDGHPMAGSLTSLVESGSLTPTTALDLGCGTGDNAIYLADHGWRVTGVDFVDKALRTAREKAGDRDVRFVKADVTQLTSSEVGSDYGLVVDSGCLHGMNDADRDAYVREVSAVTVTGGRLLIVAFTPGSSYGVPGISAEEVQRRFTDGWTPLSSGVETEHRAGQTPARFYLFERADR